MNRILSLARACYVEAKEKGDPAEAVALFSRARACLSEIEQIVLQKPPADDTSWVRLGTDGELGTAKLDENVAVR